jgi:hypothetical protein
MRIALLCLALALTTGAASAQQSPAEGNWACVANIDGKKAGLLTVRGSSYGYASANYQSAASGTGNAQLATDGVSFLDGNLVVGAGITIGLASIDANGRDTLTLHTAEKPVLSCILRSLTQY